IVKFRTTVHPRFAQFRKPSGPMTRPINLLASTRDRPTSVDRFNAGHHSGEISSERQVAASQLLQGSQTMLAVINRLHLVAVQERSQLTRVIAIIPVSIFS